MASKHRMTPARRAALRKAQLASAAKRRRKSGNSASKSVRRAARQKARYYSSSARLPKNKKRIKKIVKRTAIAGAVGYGGLAVAAGAYAHHMGKNNPSHKKRHVAYGAAVGPGIAAHDLLSNTRVAKNRKLKKKLKKQYKSTYKSTKKRR